MCCSQHFTIHLLALQNILFFDRHRASYVTLLIYMLDSNLYTRLHLVTSPGCHSEKLSGFHIMHIPIDFINENAIFLRINVIVTL